MPDDILELSVLTALRPPRFRGPRYRIGPLAARSGRSIPTVRAGIRAGAFAGLSIVAVLAVPFFLVLGARAPEPQAFATAPVAEGARVWTDSDAAALPASTRIAEARPAEPVAAPAGAGEAASRARAGVELGMDLGVELIPVLDDESGDLSIAAIAPVAEAAPTRIEPPRRSARPAGPMRAAGPVSP